MTLRNLMHTNGLGKQTNARIIERQSTFVRFITKDSVEYKINYIDKHEYLIEELKFVGVEVTENHPLLDHYQQNKVNIYLSSKVEEPKGIIEEFEKMVKSEFNGWRDLQECFREYNLLRSIFEGGYGILYSGPEVLAEKVEKVLQKNDIKYKFELNKTKDIAQVKALLMGDNIVVAKDFNIEQL